MEKKSEIMNELDIQLTIDRLSVQIIEQHHELEDLLLIGIKSRGVPLAKRIAGRIKAHSGKEIAVGTMDISLYRDDLTMLSSAPIFKGSKIDADVNDKTVIICDDVLFTGKTVYKTLQQIYKLGTPAAVKLVALIDRGHHKIPIEAAFIGRMVPTSKNEVIKVAFEETDDEDKVSIMSL